MKIFVVNSDMDRVKKHIADGNIKEAIDMLLPNLEVSSLSEPFFYQVQNDLILLRSRFARLEREKKAHAIGYDDYDLQCNNISDAFLGILRRLESEIISAPLNPKSKTGHTYKAELLLDMDFENTTEEEIQAVLDKIGDILRMRPNELKIISKRAGSIVLEMELSAEALIKIKSLVKTGLIEKLKDVRSVEDDWQWIDKGAFGLILNEIKLVGLELRGADLSEANLRRADFSRTYLNGANLSGANLSGANLSGANLSGANLSGANLSGANLSGANLSGANLGGANLNGADLSVADLPGTDLRRTDLSGTTLLAANLRGADLSEANFNSVNISSLHLSAFFIEEADLSKADLRGANLRRANIGRTKLRGAKLEGANLYESIFYINQIEILEKMHIDISEVIFVDDEGKNVANLVEAK